MEKLKLILTSLFRKGGNVKKIGRVVLEVLASLMGLAVVAFVILAARLSMGPVNLDFLTPKIEQALNVSPGFKTSIKQTQLVWREWTHPFEIELNNLQVQRGEKREWLKIEHVGVSLFLTSLLKGEIVLKHIRIYRPRIGFERDENGKFSLGFEEGGEDQEFSFETLTPFLTLGGASLPSKTLDDLRKISIVDAAVVLRDEQTNQEWELPTVSFTLHRHRRGFKALLTLVPLKESGDLHVRIRHTLGAPELELSLKFHQVAMESLIKKERLSFSKTPSSPVIFDEIMAFFQHWNAPLNGKISLTFIPEDLEVIEGSGNLDFGKGTLDLSVANLRPLPVEAGNFSFTLSPRTIELSNLSLLSQNMLLQFSGKLFAGEKPLALTRFLEKGQILEMKGKVEDLLVDHLAALWPQNVATLAREWITKNMRKGKVTEASFYLKGHGMEDRFSLETLEGTIRGEDTEVTYLEGLPPVQHTNAFATFDKKGFDIKVTSGEVAGIKVQEGHILIKDLDTDDEFFVLDAKGGGPLSGILNVLEHKPFQYATYAEIDPAKVEGKAKFSLHFEFPLIRDLSFKHIKMAATGTCKNVAFERPLTKDLTAQLREGSFTLALTQEEMQIQGVGTLNNLPASLMYKHFFTSSPPHELEILVNTEGSFEDLKRLGFDYTSYGAGPLRVRLLYALERDKTRNLTADVNLTNASLHFEPLEWSKKSGEPTSLSFKLVFDKTHLSKMNSIRFSSPLYSLGGEILFTSQNDWETIYLSELRGPHTAAEVNVRRPGKEKIALSLQGKSLNIEPLLKFMNEDNSQQDYHPLNLNVAVDLAELRLGQGRVFRDIKADANISLEGKDVKWEEVKLKARTRQEKGGHVTFNIIPGSDNTQVLNVRADNAGEFLRVLDIYKNLQDGTLLINAVRKPGGPYQGLFRIDYFDAHKVPLMARFAAILSPMGIANLFSEEESLSMEHFKCLFTFDENSITVKDGVGKSISLGFTVKGNLDRKKRTYALEGNIIPARFINSILNNIPLIGTFLSGGKGEGLFAMGYTVEGPFDNPEISVNPLSMLAPGFLRNLFSPSTWGE